MRHSPQTDGSSLLSLVSVRPMLMLTGFLGAGKTTLLRELLDHLANQGHLADVILNDRENAYIDKETLKDHAAEVTALTGSCVCCEAYDELVDMILKASKSQHDLLMIELNGTADPVPLLESFTLLESKFCLRPRWQVCVIDARYFRKRRRFNDLESLQLETASHYYISQNAKLNEEETTQIEEEIQVINPRATRTNASQLADSLSQAIRNNLSHALVTKKATQGLASSKIFNLAPPAEEKLHIRHKLAHEFTGCNIIFPKPVDSSLINGWLEKLPSSVIRVKALLTLETVPNRRYLYERVGSVISPNQISVRSIDKVPCSGIFIGADIDPQEILQLTQEFLHPDCHFPTL